MIAAEVRQHVAPDGLVPDSRERTSGIRTALSSSNPGMRSSAGGTRATSSALGLEARLEVVQRRASGSRFPRRSRQGVRIAPEQEDRDALRRLEEGDARQGQVLRRSAAEGELAGAKSERARGRVQVVARMRRRKLLQKDRRVEGQALDAAKRAEQPCELLAADLGAPGRVLRSHVRRLIHHRPILPRGSGPARFYRRRLHGLGPGGSRSSFALRRLLPCPDKIDHQIADQEEQHHYENFIPVHFQPPVSVADVVRRERRWCGHSRQIVRGFPICTFSASRASCRSRPERSRKAERASIAIIEDIPALRRQLTESGRQASQPKPSTASGRLGISALPKRHQIKPSIAIAFR